MANPIETQLSIGKFIVKSTNVCDFGKFNEVFASRLDIVK